MTVLLRAVTLPAFVTLALLSPNPSPTTPHAPPAKDKPCAGMSCYLDGEGASVQATAGVGGRRSAPSRPGFRTRLTPACPGNDANLGGPYEIECPGLKTYCTATGAGTGALSWVWRQRLDSTGTPHGPWARAGQVCNKPLPRQGLSLADVRRAFRQVAFARPLLASQPQGAWTLVNLDTYYLVQWPKAGVRPGQVVTVRLLGHRVKIRPRIDTYLYDYGDGQTLRTTDPGAPYPNGRITHAYQHTGDVRVAVTARYTADFAIDHGPYRALDDTVDITSPTRTITIYEARAHLIPNPGEE